MDKIKGLLNKKQKAVSQEDTEKKKGEKPKPNPKRLIIVGVIAVSCLYLIFDEMTKEPEAPAKTPQELALEEKIRKKKEAMAAAAKAKESESGTDTKTEDVPPEGSTTPGEVALPTDTEAPPVVDAPTDTTTPPSTDEPTDTTIPPVVDDPSDSSSDSSSDVPVVDVPTDTPSDPPVVDVPTDGDTPTDSSTFPSDTVGEGTSPESDGDMTEKILEDLEKQVKSNQPKRAVTTYVAPPDYEYRGRGLVYNCVGKHWACVDGASYRSCEDNFSSTKYLKKNVECYPFNVYDAPRGCENMQNRVVSSNAKTDFCKGH